MFWLRKKQQFDLERFLKKAAKFDPFEIKKYDELFYNLKDKPKFAEPNKLGMKLLVISDTHGELVFGENRFPNYLDTIGEFDLCVLLGDVHPCAIPTKMDTEKLQKTE